MVEFKALRAADSTLSLKAWAVGMLRVIGAPVQEVKQRANSTFIEEGHVVYQIHQLKCLSILETHLWTYHKQCLTIYLGIPLLLLLSHFSRVQLCATPETAAHQAPLSLGFSRQEHWSGLPFPSPMHESEK